MNGQDHKCKKFIELSRPEKCWVFTHPFVAAKAWRITKQVRETTAIILHDGILDNYTNGGQVDAFRHTYWMLSLSQEMSWKKAKRLGKAHEKGNYLAFKKRKLEDGSVPDSISSVMDKFNNELGLRLAKENKDLSLDSLKQLVIKKILDGEARIISRNGEGLFIDSSGATLDIKNYAGKWSIPKILVPSDSKIN